jgi:hypothetical protein
MFRGTGVTSSVTQAAGASATGLSASPKVLVVLVKTKAVTCLATASSRRRRVPVMFVSTKLLSGVRGHVGLVQRGRVQDRVDAAHGALDLRPIDDGAHARGEWRRHQVQADDLVATGLERADQRLAEMPGAAGDEDSHGALPPDPASHAEPGRAARCRLSSISRPDQPRRASPSALPSSTAYAYTLSSVVAELVA